MWKVFRKIFLVVGFIIWIIGLVGIPDNLSRWANMDSIATINQSIVKWILFGTGMCIVFICSGVYKKAYSYLNTKYRNVKGQKQLKLYFGIYWDEELNPYCPACKTPLTLISDSRPNCYKCNKIIPIVDSEKRMGLAEARRIINSQQQAVETLKKQLKPKLLIDFDLKNFPSCLDGTSNTYKHPQTGETVCVAFSQKWRIFVYNSSTTETVTKVEVKLRKIDKCLSEQDSKLPVHLKLMHDTKPYKYFFNINPKSRRFFDVIECFMKSVQINRNHFVIQHIENVYPYLVFDLDKDNYKITIEVEGNNITCEPKDFIIGLKDDRIQMWPV